ncbi:MAG: Calx-beta domain-containing protein, partial [bacterium]|nr:Calx-beta domain-containing protein [bacterium]
MTSQKSTLHRRGRPYGFMSVTLVSLALSLLLVVVTISGINYFSPLEQASAHPSVPYTDAWTVDGEVLDIATDGSSYYLAGNFGNTNPYNGHGVAINKSDWELADSVLSRIEGIVRAAVPDGTGGWFVGGDFVEVDNQTFWRLVHIEADGSVTATWNPDVDGPVQTLLLDGTTLYVGGSFTRVLGSGGPIQWRAAAFDVSDLSTVTLLPWDPNLPDTVYSIKKNGSYIFLGGNFNWANNSANTGHSGLAAVDPLTGSVEPNWQPSADSVRDLEVTSDGSVVYIGGTFTSVKGVGRDDLAAVSGPNGVDDATLFDWNPDTLGSIEEIELSSDESIAFVGGNFSRLRHGQVDELLINHLAAISADETDASATPVTTWQPNPSAQILNMVRQGDTLYLSGSFNSVGGLARRKFANIDVSSLASVSVGSLSLLPKDSGTTLGWSIYPSTDEVFVGGSFSAIGGEPRNMIAEFDLLTDEPTTLDLQMQGNQVERILIDDNILYIAGNFSEVLGQPRDNLAAVDLDTLTVLDWNPDPNNRVYDMAIYEDELYVGGTFTTLEAGAQSRARLATFDISDTSNITLTAFNPGVGNLIVYEVEADATNVYVGGSFTLAGNNGGSPGTGARSRLAALNKSTGAADLSWVTPSNSVFVMDLDQTSDLLYIGGAFTSLDAIPRRAAALDVSTGQPTGWAPTLNGAVKSLYLDENVVYVSGSFTTCNGVAQRICAYEYDGTPASWSPDLGTGAPAVRAPIVRQGGRLHVGGGFASVAGEDREGYVQFLMTQVEFENASSSAPEADPSTIVTVQATQPDTVSANIAVVGGTATDTTDFELLTSTVNFTPGNSTADIDLTLDNDQIAEADETVILEIEQVSSTGVSGSITQHTLTIQDDDTASVALAESAGQTEVAEGGASDTYEVQLTSQPLNDVEVTATVGDPSELTVSPASLSFTSLDWSTPQEFSVEAIDDPDVDGTQTVEIDHVATSGDGMYDGVGVLSVTVTVLDNDSVSSPPDSPGTPGADPTTPTGVQVIDGPDPITQAIAVSRDRFDAGLADGVALARSDVSVDSLTGGPFVNLKNLSLLLTEPTGLNAQTLSEIDRALGDTAKPIYLIGGQDALSSQVESNLHAAGYDQIFRFAGDDRRQTARLLA